MQKRAVIIVSVSKKIDNQSEKIRGLNVLFFMFLSHTPCFFLLVFES